jgi:Kef-type K+ transport system membrane component KefB
MDNPSLFYSFFLIFTGAAIITTLALYCRQPLLVAYIVFGACIGPYGAAYIVDLHLLADISQIGIIFLLFLLGLDLQPRALLATLKQSSQTAFLSSVIFAVAGYTVARLFGFSQQESFLIGCSMMFSSTIIGIKLLPTTVLHHKHTGELMIGMLLVQDLLAIMVLIILISGDLGQVDFKNLFMVIALLPALTILAFGIVKYVLLRIITRFDYFHEYIFLLAIGWCLGFSELAKVCGLSHEIGAFIAGISLASSPISQFIVLNLKPLRDFFLILFFFSIGAQLKLDLISAVFLPLAVLSVLVLAGKPLIFRVLLREQSESKKLAWDIGFRLGQNSEFAMLIAFVGIQANWLGEHASLLIQATAIITILLSSYIVILNYPSPVAIHERLRRD